MKAFFKKQDPKSRDEAAARWVFEADKGLSPKEQDALHEWLAADPGNREAFASYQRIWNEFDRLAGLDEALDPMQDDDLLGPARKRSKFLDFPRWQVGLAIAATLVAALGLWMTHRGPELESPEITPNPLLVQRIEQRELPDGSTVELKRGSALDVHYSANERRVVLTRGEATFSVAKDASRPFRVAVGPVQLEALGTVFNVRDSMERVDVLVTEGRVKLTAAPLAQPQSADEPLSDVTEPEQEPQSAIIESSQRATVSTDGQARHIRVATVEASLIEQELLWRPKRLDFYDTPLHEIIKEFNRRNEIQIVLKGEGVSDLKITSFFWSDDVEAFVRLMEKGFQLRAEWSSETQLVLSAPPGPNNPYALPDL